MLSDAIKFSFGKGNTKVCVFCINVHSVTSSSISTTTTTTTTRVGEECVSCLLTECVIQMIWSLQGRFCGWPHLISNSLSPSLS